MIGVTSIKKDGKVVHKLVTVHIFGNIVFFMSHNNDGSLCNILKDDGSNLEIIAEYEYK